MSLPRFFLSRPSQPQPPKSWTGEKLYFRGDDYFRGLLRAIHGARKSVDFETYIFEPGRLGDQVAAALVKAARRKVKVRVLVDGVGSPQFASTYGPLLEKAGIPYRVYRSWPTFFSTIYKRFRLSHFFKSLQKDVALFDSGKHRDHRKQVIIDNRAVWIGSFNVSDWHLVSEKGNKAWRDTGIALSGVKNLVFKLAFQATWEDPWPYHFHRLYRHSLIQWLSYGIEESPIRMTANQRLRRAFRRELLKRIRGARTRVWITTPYFVPTGPLWRALLRAAKRGCDLRIILPERSDVPMVRWASMAYYPKLLKAGGRLWEYQRSVLHAKTTMIDEWVLVGSSNLDYRSLRKDLEINVVPQNPKTIRALEKRFELDQAQSHEVKPEELKRYPPGTRLLSWFFFQFRYWF